MTRVFKFKEKTQDNADPKKVMYKIEEIETKTYIMGVSIEKIEIEIAVLQARIDELNVKKGLLESQ